jgi:hypothetical protein
LQKSLPCANAQATLCGWTQTHIIEDRGEGRTYNKNIGKSWADGSAIIGFSFFSFGLGMTSNTELFIVNFNKSFSIIIGCGQTEFYFPTFANT